LCLLILQHWFLILVILKCYLVLCFSILVLRVWDVLLFEGNRVMLFRTALALMELYGIELYFPVFELSLQTIMCKLQTKLNYGLLYLF